MTVPAITAVPGDYVHDPDRPRCGWVPPDDALYCWYHDTEWGRVERDPKALWAKLILDGQQAGLAWITILRKRDNFMRAYDGLDPDIVAHYTDADRARLLTDPGIIRSRAKIDATLSNARAYLDMREAGIDFSDHLWSFVGGAPIVNGWEDYRDAPVKSPESEALAKDLKARGFKFVGPVIVYAFMQAVGMVNDHEACCPDHAACAQSRRV